VHRRQKRILDSKLRKNSITKTNHSKDLQSMHIKVVHSLTTMMSTKLTTTAFKRKSWPATTALEESLSVDEDLTPMQRKKTRYSLEGDNSSKSGPYGMSSLWREMEDLEHTSAFPTIEWSFDDDIRVASERGSTSKYDGWIRSRHFLKTACLAPAALKTTACLLSEKTVE
jgi:hypothetical protein